MRKKALLTYNAAADQWGFKQQGRWCRVSCGEQFGLQIGATCVGCRLELDGTLVRRTS
jgi:hypothetical protein